MSMLSGCTRHPQASALYRIMVSREEEELVHKACRHLASRGAAQQRPNLFEDIKASLEESWPQSPPKPVLAASVLPCIARYGSLYEEILKHRMQLRGSYECFPGELRVGVPAFAQSPSWQSLSEASARCATSPAEAAALPAPGGATETRTI